MEFPIFCTDCEFREHNYPQLIKDAGFKLKEIIIDEDEDLLIFDTDYHIELSTMDDLLKLQKAVNSPLILTSYQAIEIYNSYRE
jgi:hypothetical protein